MAHQGFKPGNPKPPGSGRKKGTPNKSTQTLLQKCEAKGIDLFDAFLEIINDPLDPNRFNAIKEAAQYVYPKRKAIEHSLDPALETAVREVSELSTEQKIEAHEQAIKELKSGG